ncbi:MAG TPA: hypothetical protein VGB98_04830 [Pyrinomonadaceae bacterium]
MGKSLTNSTVMSGAQAGVREVRLVYRRAPRRRARYETETEGDVCRHWGWSNAAGWWR